MFAYRHDILKAMIADGARLVVLGRKEKLSDLPEFKESRNQAGFDEVRYLDYTPALKLLVVPEENVLGLSGDPFAGECMVVSVFAKALYRVAGLRPSIADFDRQREQAAVRTARETPGYRVRPPAGEALRRGAAARDSGRARRAAQSRSEYWAAGVEAYFDATGAGHPPALADRPITTREALKAYDPGLYALVEETMAYTGHIDWRFKR